MSKFAIAFVLPSTECHLMHKIVESETRDSALRKFFDEEINSVYSADQHGFNCFREDFFDDQSKSGDIIEL